MSLLNKLFEKKPAKKAAAEVAEAPAPPAKAPGAPAGAPPAAQPAPGPSGALPEISLKPEALKPIEVVVPIKSEKIEEVLPSPKPEELVVLDVPLKRLHPGAVPRAVPPRAPAGAPPAPAPPRPPGAPPAAPAVPPLKPLFAELEALAKPEPAPAPPRPPGAPPAAPAKPISVSEARREARRARLEEEATVDAILRDIIKDVEVQAAEARPGAPVHRMYLLRRTKPEERATPEGGVRVIASRKLAEKEEFQSMVGDVYGELRKSKKEKEGLKETLEVKKPPKEAAEAKPPEVTFEELMGVEPAPAPPGSPGAPPAASAVPPLKPLFAELEALAKPEVKAPPLAKPPEVEFVKLQAEPGMGCPYCKTKGLRIVFCPYCGNGLCANCSPKITPKPEAIAYVCPSCGEEVMVRKRGGP